MNPKYKYRIGVLLAATIICLVIIYLTLLSHKRTEQIYLEYTKETITNLKKDFLKDTVINLSIEIDTLRETKYNIYKKDTEDKLRWLQNELDLLEEDFVMFLIDKFNDSENNDKWASILWNQSTGEILYNSLHWNTGNIDRCVGEFKNILSSYAEIEKDNIKGIFELGNLI